MAGSRTLKLSILADVDDLKQKLNAGATEVAGFGTKLADFGKKATLAFAAAGAAAAAYAGKLLVDGVKSAIEDEKAQATLAKTLENVTNATRNQIAAVEDFILQTSLAYGVTDKELRPAFDRLVRSTDNVKEAQKLLNVAINISAATGIGLESVVNALSKAHDGNVAALKKLGIETQKTIYLTKDNSNSTNALEKAQLAYNHALEKYNFMSPQVEKAQLALYQAQEKANTTTTTAKKVNLEFDEILKNLSNTFGGQAAIAAETFEIKLARLKIAFDEGKETVGSFVLDAITPLVTTIIEKIIPTISQFSNSLGQKLLPAFTEISNFISEYLIPTFQTYWTYIQDVIIPGIIKTFTPILQGLFNAFQSVAAAIKNNQEKLQPFYDIIQSIAAFIVKVLAPAVGTILGKAFEVFGKILAGIITAFANLVNFLDKSVKLIKELVNLIKSNPLLQGLGDVIGKIFGGGRATGGSVTPSNSYLVGERGPELFVPNSAGRIIPNNSLGGNTININVSGAIDPIATARAIAQVLGREATTNGTFTNLGVSRVVTV